MAARTRCLLLFVAVSIFLAGCASRKVRLPSAPPSSGANTDYIDIQAGWRLTVVSPILKSGGYTPEVALTSKQTAMRLHFLAGPDLLGYETAHYAVKGQRGGRVRVEFSSAQVVRDGKAEGQSRPIRRLFQDAHRPSYLRLIYLVRVSQADHNMAVIAARRLDALDSLTRQVEANPCDACKFGRFASCSWIPEGIAVRPEALKAIRGIQTWVDAPH